MLIIILCLFSLFQVSFPYYAAFNSLLAKMELIKRVFLSQVTVLLFSG